MTAATPQRIGQVNGAGATDALFLKVFGGEVLTAYEVACKTADKTMVRMISHGKSAQFPATWKVTAAYHTPGAELVGQVSNVNERVITIDDMLVSDVFIPQIDEAKNHFEYRSEYSKQAGIALATADDKSRLQVGVLAARASATVTGGSGGLALTHADMPTDATKIVDAIEDAMQNFDEKNIPEGDTKYTFIKPAHYYLLTAYKDLVNRDWVHSNTGDFGRAEIMVVKGTTLVKTNNLPSTDISTGPTAYQGNFTKTVALVMTKAAVGVVKLMDLQTEMEWDIRRQGTLIVAKYLQGAGILRPECAVEIADA